MRDKRVEKELRSLGWRPLVLWECELRGKTEPERSSRLWKLAKEIRKPAQRQD